MSHQADFYQSRTASVAQAMGSTVTWTWKMADLDRYMHYAVVPKRANATVIVNEISVTSDGNLNPTAGLTVTVLPGRDTGLCHLTFHAVRIPTL